MLSKGSRPDCPFYIQILQYGEIVMGVTANRDITRRMLNPHSCESDRTIIPKGMTGAVEEKVLIHDDMICITFANGKTVFIEKAWVNEELPSTIIHDEGWDE